MIGVPDPRWGERPLVVVVLRPGARTGPEELRYLVAARIPRWWVPERFSVVAELPRTSVGKLDKRGLRARFGAGTLAVVEVGRGPAASPEPSPALPAGPTHP